MTDREKLIALIRQCSCAYSPPCTGECGECNNVGMYDSEIANIADHLLANGVVVREKGEWVYDHWCEFKCSKCGALSKTEPRGEENFCPNCGADMIGGDRRV